LKINQPVALDVSDDEAEPKAAQIMLELHVSINGHEDIEGPSRQPQQFTVLAASPARFGDSFHRVTGEGVLESRRQTLV
jgi:hypothetical protein